MKSMLLVAISLSAIWASAQEMNMMGRQSHNVGINVVPATGAVNVDGNFDDWDWSGRIWVFADTSVRARYSVEIAAMWDANYLYLGAIWKDPTPMYNMVNPAFNPNEGWKSDCWQIRVLTDKISHLTTWYFTGEQKPVMHINNNPRGHGGENIVLHDGTGPDIGRGVQMAFRKHDDGAGYNQEIRIPWNLLYDEVPEIKAGKEWQLGFELLWGDPTGSAWPMHRYADNMAPNMTSRQFYWSNNKAWGTAKLLEEGNITPRQYISGEGQLEGTVPVRVDIPANAARFTIVIEDEAGARVRNLAGDFDPVDYSIEVKNGVRTVEVRWDCLDDQGQMVKPGTYTVHGLSHAGLGAEYEICFYNPGTPPWTTRDGSGAWGSDHHAPLRVAAAGDWMIVTWAGAEGGSGIIGVDPSGRKRWGEKRGASVVAADADYVYAVTHSTYARGVLTRFTAKAGKPAPFMLEGKARPFELTVRQIFDRDDAANIMGLAVHGDMLVLSMSDNKLAVLDKKTAVPQKILDVQSSPTLAFDAEGELHAVINNNVQRVNLETGATEPVPAPGVDTIAAIAFDNDGNLAIGDSGPDSQVKVFNPAGELVYTAGRKGGRPLRGAFDEQAMMRISSVAVDSTGNIWVVESWNDPRRVSVWGRDGELVRDYIGNTAYAGTGSYLHPENPDLAYVGSVEMKLDRENGTYEVTRVLWVPDFNAGEAFPLWAHPHNFPNPKKVISEASGTRREYIYFNGVYSRYHAIYIERDKAFVPVAAIGNVKDLPQPIRQGIFKDVPDRAAFFWNDANRDGKITLDECIIVENGLSLTAGWGQLPGDDLSIYTQGITRFRPIRFTDEGAPVYGPEGVEVLNLNHSGDIAPVDDENLLIALSWRPNILYGVDAKTAEVRWMYPNRYPGVHGSHRSPMPSPGMLIGPLRVLGVADVSDEAGRVFAMRGNLGEDFFMTTDGLYVGAMFQDGRLPAPALPDTEELLHGMPMEMLSVGGEPFNGWFGRQADGKIRLLTGQPRQAGMILEMKGLETIRRFSGQQISLDVPLLLKAEQENAARAVQEEEAKDYVIKRIEQAPKIDGNPAEWRDIPAMEIQRRGSPQRGTAKLAYDDTNLYVLFAIDDPSPWLNEGRDFTRLFKTGDAVDVQLGTNPGADTGRRNPVAGDLRVVFSQVDGKPVAVLMKPIDPEAPEEVNRTYESPVVNRSFDRVQIMSNARVAVRTTGNSYTVEAAVPLAEIGLNPQAGMKIIGDAGFIASDAQGRINVARTYWSNKLTNLVSDKPAESWLYPNQWGTLTFE